MTFICAKKKLDYFVHIWDWQLSVSLLVGAGMQETDHGFISGGVTLHKLIFKPWDNTTMAHCIPTVRIGEIDTHLRLYSNKNTLNYVFNVTAFIRNCKSIDASSL